MLYVCTCGFTAASATTFYKHLAALKGDGHKLAKARFSDKYNNPGSNPDNISEPADQQAPSTATWVEEYLMVDQRESTAQGQVTATQSLQEPLPVSSAPSGGAYGQLPQAAKGLDDVPLRDLQSMSRGWTGLGRHRASTVGRPPISPGRAGAGAMTGLESQQPEIDSDEVEIVENVRYSNSGADQGGASGNHSNGTTTQAALRMSGSVVNAMVVGLSPWRWFGNRAGSPNSAAGDQGPGPYRGLGPQPNSTGVSSGGAASDHEPVVEFGPSTELAHADWPTASLDPVHAVRDVLIWRNPWRTTRVFGAGLYLAICVQQLTKGHELLQPSTAIFGLCFFLLVRNLLREAAATYRRNHQQQYQVLETREVAEPAPSPQDEDVERRKANMMLQQQLEATLQGIALGAARYGASLLVLTSGLLSGRRAITSALVAVLLWLGMVLGELRLVSQPMFWLLCYIAVFTIPAAYYRCRHAMDAGVEAALRFTVRVLVSGSRMALLMASGVALVLVIALPLNFVLRASLAAGAAFSVLLWQSELVRRGHAGVAASMGGLAGGYVRVEGGAGSKAGQGGRLMAGSPGHAHGE